MKLINKVSVKLIPIVLGYLPVAISFTLIAVEAGLSNAEIIAMSILVLGAASQIAAIPLIDGGYSIIYIFFITLLINFRHAALAATLAPCLQKLSFPELALFSYGLTDEAFSIHALDIERERFAKHIAIAVNVGVHFIWVMATVVGCFVGAFIVKYFSFIRLDFALPAMFLSIVTLYFKGKIQKQELQVLVNYILIIVVTIILTLLFLLYSFKSLAFFMPALIMGGLFLGGFILKNK